MHSQAFHLVERLWGAVRFCQSLTPPSTHRRYTLTTLTSDQDTGMLELVAPSSWVLGKEGAPSPQTSGHRAED